MDTTTRHRVTVWAFLDDSADLERVASFVLHADPASIADSVGAVFSVEESGLHRGYEGLGALTVWTTQHEEFLAAEISTGKTALLGAVTWNEEMPLF